MIILSNSIPKSGSSLLHRYTMDITYGRIGAASPAFLLEKIRSGEFPGRGGFVSDISKEILEALITLSDNQKIVVKTHAKYIPEFKDYINSGELMITYIIRNPIDCLLSAMDNYERTKYTSRPEFEDFKNLNSGLKRIKIFCRNALQWINRDKVLIIKYEDFIPNHKNVIRQCCDYLSLNTDDVFIDRMIEYHDKNKNPRYNTGKVNRYKEEMSKEVFNICKNELGSLLGDLGY